MCPINKYKEMCTACPGTSQTKGCGFADEFNTFDRTGFDGCAPLIIEAPVGGTVSCANWCNSRELACVQAMKASTCNEAFGPSTSFTMQSTDFNGCLQEWSTIKCQCGRAVHPATCDAPSTPVYMNSGRGCPDSSSCLSDNTGYSTLSEAWRACASVNACDFITFEAAEGTFNLRRASDPVSALPDNKLYEFHCREEKRCSYEYNIGQRAGADYALEGSAEDCPHDDCAMESGKKIMLLEDLR
jgi:hypothetical protein